MGLFDGFAASQQFGEGGGLLARLRAIQQEQDQYQPDAGFDPPPAAPQFQTFAPTPWSNSSNAGQASANPQSAAPNPTSQYQALLPLLGDHDAMLATVSPDDGKTMIAQAVAGQQPDSSANVVQAGFRFGGIPFPLPPMAPVPPPQIRMPDIPEWMKTAGAILQLLRRGGSGGGSGNKRNRKDDEDDICGERLGLETSRCYGRIEEYAHQDFLSGCRERAKDRWRLCFRTAVDPIRWNPQNGDRLTKKSSVTSIDRALPSVPSIHL
jgi:hypothetical protein